ncbi:SsgA family sporulation/cell division regulator [Streptomyces sp. Ru73]|uniref:SsgA family sporulation/cell division regulator n=1 Tax=Streptomyces sp. Ru73 TaxID=2080748 RepID=UPI0021563C5B|nr:SsgA family sporulation/cell division regulator [Streptomyces sp. Ru73]
MAATTRTLELQLLLGPDTVVPVAGRFSYRSDRPFEVRVAFVSQGRTVATWVFARELLLAGLRGPAGEGNVRMRPFRDSVGLRRVHIELRAPGSECALTAEATDLAAWVRATSEVVPPGQEGRHLDLDAHLARLFAERN